MFPSREGRRASTTACGGSRCERAYPIAKTLLPWIQSVVRPVTHIQRSMRARPQGTPLCAVFVTAAFPAGRDPANCAGRCQPGGAITRTDSQGHGFWRSFEPHKFLRCRVGAGLIEDLRPKLHRRTVGDRCDDRVSKELMPAITRICHAQRLLRGPIRAIFDRRYGRLGELP